MLQKFLRRCGAILPAVTAAVLMLSSCSHKTMLPYFRDVTESEVQLTVPKQVEIEPDDELYIMVSSPQPTATAQFNFPTINPASGESTLVNAGSKQLTYFVDAEGNIDIPALGKVHVAGLTVEQIQTKIKDLISKWVDNPSVEVRLMSFRVNMLGEFTKPGTVVTDRKTYTILQAIADAGDLTPYGRRDKVLLIREDGGKQKRVILDLTKSDLLTSEYYYLQPNDVIYVMPNNVREGIAKYDQSKSYNLSMISTIVSATSVIASLIIALTVK
ncbi:MAG: polysaccharide biosynthesis/export family protein [Muribaculaceae bacterium]|nr:polysaccharide export protein [Bacteroidales bacterium]MDY4811147.1 polysaccharide biosynthesis/export family protein [Muribaculaceae bacterium]